MNNGQAPIKDSTAQSSGQAEKFNAAHAAKDNASLAAAKSQQGNLGKREIPSSPLPPRRQEPPRGLGRTPNKAAIDNAGDDLRRKKNNQSALPKLASAVGGLPGKALALASGVKNAISNRGQKAAADGISKAEPSNSSSNDTGSNSEDKKQNDEGQELFDKLIKGSFNIPRVIVKVIVMVVPITVIILFFVIAVLGDLLENGTSSYLAAGLVDEVIDEYGISGAVDLINGRDPSGKGMGDTSNLQLGMGMGSGETIPDEYYERMKILGNVFSSEPTCSGSDCSDRPEVLYYLKVADLANRYKSKYGVDLDWFLLVATDLYSADTQEEGMEANLGGYDKDKASDMSTPSELDWDTDFTRISGYRYLDSDDSRYDLNILAKNMVKKTTVQSCGKTSRTDIDVEDEYFEPGGEKRLPCSSGYSKYSTYEIDLDKYDEFLLEYIDKKMYPKKGIAGNNLAEVMVNLAVAQLEDPSAHGGAKYKEFMGWGGSSGSAWCAAFVSWVVANTEYNNTKLSDIIPVKSGVVYGFAHWMYESEDPNINFYWNDRLPKFKGKNGSTEPYTPKPGDLIFYDWNCNWNGRMPTVYGDRLDHIAIVQRVEGDRVITIEGNMSNSVMELSYPLTTCRVAGYGSWYEG